MRSMAAMDFFGDMEEQGSAMEMDVDNLYPLEILGEGLVFYKKLADVDFFNSFDDSDCIYWLLHDGLWLFGINFSEKIIDNASDGYMVFVLLLELISDL
ncbi:hypothetical protein FNV43_RR00662 [Rhamnella rubrinervis]|uniref:Uncharacterized protein n=1 Tax=Rhamnella rubrinervis TaxID=2594499 RepID=A0A8K0MS61_9ROSA|nr:hypothetical protein FNV43_RR00662 [Rhamnella rubrinervis]